MRASAALALGLAVALVAAVAVPHATALISGLQLSAAVAEPLARVHYDDATGNLWAATRTGTYVYVLNGTTLAQVHVFDRSVSNEVSPKRTGLITFQPHGRRLLVCDNVNLNWENMQSVCDIYNLDQPTTAPLAQLPSLGIPYMFVRVFPSAATPFAVIVRGGTMNRATLVYAPYSNVTGFGTTIAIISDNPSDGLNVANICGGATGDLQRWLVSNPNNYAMAWTEVYHADFDEGNNELRLWCQSFLLGGTGFTRWVGPSSMAMSRYDMSVRPPTANVAGTLIRPGLPINNATTDLFTIAGRIFVTKAPIVSSDGSTSYWVLDKPGNATTIVKMPVNIARFGWTNASPAVVANSTVATTSSTVNLVTITTTNLGATFQQVFFGRTIDDQSVSGTGVIFLGDTAGNVRKLRFSTSGSFAVTEFDTARDNSLPAQAVALHASSSQQLVFGAASTQVFSFPIASCGSATTCAQCGALANPYCGWCVLSNACSTKPQCATGSLASAWVSSCPAASSVTPATFAAADTTTTVVWTVNNIPDVATLTPATYTCVFASGAFTDTSAATRNGGMYECPVRAPPSPLGSGALSQAMSVQFVYNPGPLQLTLFSTAQSPLSNATVYDCGAAGSTCGACTATAFPCGFCVLQGTCTTAGACPAGPNTWASSNGACPAVTDYSPTLLPTATATTITLTATGIPNLNGGDCVFTRADSSVVTTTVSQVGLTLSIPAPNVAVAGLVNGSSTEAITAMVQYEGVTVLPVMLEFTLFDCYTLGPDCSTCADNYDTYGCSFDLLQWTCVSGGNTGGNYASAASSCPRVQSVVGATDYLYLPVNDTDYDVKVALAGQNLPGTGGAQFSYRCLYTNGAIGLSVNTSATLVGNEIRCTAAPVLPASRGSLSTLGYLNSNTTVSAYAVSTAPYGRAFQPISTTAPLASIVYYHCGYFGQCGVCRNGGVDGDLLAGSSLCSWCLSSGGSCLAAALVPSTQPCSNVAASCPLPTITSFTPTSGILAGGTQLTIFGTNLALKLADVTSISVGAVSCGQIAFVSAAQVSCVVNAAPNVAPSQLSGAIVMQTVSGTATSTGNFTFLPNPAIATIAPLKTVTAGGTVVTLTGTALANGQGTPMLTVAGVPCGIQTRTATVITCEVQPSADAANGPVVFTVDSFTYTSTASFSVRANPTVTSFEPTEAILRGGYVITMTGTDLDAVDDGPITVAGVPCERTAPATATSLSCKLDLVNSTVVGLRGVIQLSAANAVVTSVLNFTFCSDPKIENFSPAFGPGGQTIIIQGTNLRCGQEPEIVVANISCALNDTERLPRIVQCVIGTGTGAGPVVMRWTDYEAVSIGNFTFNAGGVPGDSGALPSWVVPVVVVVGVIVLLIIIALLYIYRRQVAQNLEDSSKLVQELVFAKEQQSQVISEVMDSYTEYHTTRAGVGGGLNPLFAAGAAPLLLYDVFLAEVLFSKDEGVRPPTTVNFTTRQADLAAARGFHRLLLDRTFATTFVQTLELQGAFKPADRKYAAALLMLSLKSNFTYATDLFLTLLGTYVATKVANGQQRTLLRASDSIAEKMLTAWLALALYPYLRDQVAQPLFALFSIMKAQIERGAVDCLTGSSQYTINSSAILRQKVNYDRIKIKASMAGKDAVEVEVNTCDSASQLRNRVADALGTSFRRTKEYTVVDVKGRKLQDLDESSEREDATWTKVNTIAHYEVADGSDLRLMAQDPSQEPKPAEGVRVYHLEKQVDAAEKQIAPSEVFFTRMMTTKEVISAQLDGLVRALFPSSAERAVPAPVKMLFDFLDAKARELKVTDAEVVHIWKNNSLALRFWINVITNPQHVMDVNKTVPLHNCLLTVSQVIIDAASTSDVKIGSGAPASKLLYRTEVEQFQKLVKAYYKTVAEAPPAGALPATPDVDTSFDTDTATLELLHYARKYGDEVTAALKRAAPALEGEFAALLSAEAENE